MNFLFKKRYLRLLETIPTLPVFTKKNKKNKKKARMRRIVRICDGNFDDFINIIAQKSWNASCATITPYTNELLFKLDR